MKAIMMIRRIMIRIEVEVKTKGETIPIIFMIKTIEIREEEASMENVFTMEKKGIEHLNVPNAKEGSIKE